MALSRPDITDALRKRKADAVQQSAAEINGSTTILTNCPSCLQGLGRNADLKVTPRHIIVDLAIKKGGQHWSRSLKEMISNVEVVRF
jgi:Fe-S oxidoreductase